MEKEKFKKIISVIIILALAGSLLAVGQWNIQEDSAPRAPTNLKEAFTYDISFDANVIKELNSVRIAAETSNLDKQEIDFAVKDIDAVSRIAYSQFRASGENWIYFAEIDLKRNADIQETVNEILSLNYFGRESQVMKKVTINTPSDAIKVFNQELDVNRNFTFSYPTTFAIADLSSMPGDKINVNGVIELRGQDITSIELIENLQPVQVTFEKTLELLEKGDELFFNAIGNIDENSFREALKQIDENSMIYVFEEQIYGKINSEKENELNELLIDLNNIILTTQGTFYLEKAFVEDLNKELIFNQNIYSEISNNKIIGEEINIEITISILKDEFSVLGATQKE